MYLLLGQFSVTFEYRPGALHNNADGMSRQCGQCRRPDCPVSAADLPTIDNDTRSLLVDQPFATFTFRDDCGYLGIGRAGSIPFVSDRPGAYGRLLLAVFVRWKSGLLVSSDWFKPVIRGAWRGVLSGRTDEPDRAPEPGEGS